MNYLKITDAAGGTGVEVGSLSMLINEQIMLYASGYDEFGNYTRDVIANWGVTGTLESPSPTFGKFTVFSPDIPGTFGEIFADTTGILSDTTGTISVSATIDYVKIRTAPNGEGSELFNFTMTADENIELYCAGYDNGDNYIGDVVVQWMSTGELSPVIDQTGVSINFQPSLAPASGTIIADHSSGSDDTTGVINVLPGVPVGEITLTPSPQILPADGASISIVRSGNIYDAESNIISENTHFELGRVGYGSQSYSYYPLLHLFSVSLNKISGLPLIYAALYIVPVLNASFVSILMYYLNFEFFGLRGRIRNIATLLFAMGWYYTLFQSQFTREVFAFPFALLSILIAAKITKKSRREHGVMLPILFAAVILSHHMSSYMLFVILAIIALTLSIFHKNNRV